jgi:predicted DNA-binding transcriptional regulator YafY
MGINRNAYIRYKAIDLRLRNRFRPAPNMEGLIDACEKAIDYRPSVETIQKDIKMMREDPPKGFAAPIKFCRRNLVYEYTDINYSIDQVGLNDADIEGIKKALEVINSIGTTRVSQQFAHSMGKVLSVYNEEFTNHEKNRKIIQTDQIPVYRGIEHFDVLFRACSQEIPISVIHYSYDKMRFNATVLHPRILKEFENRWYVVGYSEDHDCIRTFGLDRLYDPVLLKKKMIKVNQEEEELYLKDVYGVYPFSAEKKQTIHIKASSLVINYLMAYPIHSSQKVVSRSQYGHGEITFELIPSHELIRLFRSYGNEIEVLKPEWINTEIFQEKRQWQRRRQH